MAEIVAPRTFMLRRLLRALTGIALLSGIAATMFSQRFLTIDSGEVKGDAIILLGGAPEGRPERAAELFMQGDAPRILVSGFGDSQSFVRVLERNGVPANLITQESNSRTTWENAKFSVPLLRQMGAHRVIIVTSWYHSRRALACLRHFAPDITFYSRPSYFAYACQEWGRQYVGIFMAFEYVKILRYWVWYGVCPYSL